MIAVNAINARTEGAKERLGKCIIKYILRYIGWVPHNPWLNSHSSMELASKSQNTASSVTCIANLH